MGKEMQIIAARNAPTLVAITIAICTIFFSLAAMPTIHIGLSMVS
jgi:hypothetical protein